MEDKFYDECGIFGILSSREDVAYDVFLGLYALQHRGQESAGICTNNDGRFMYQRGMGLVQNVFDDTDLARLKGDMAIGHVRYSTFGGSRVQDSQPIIVKYKKGEVAIAHNGNIVNALQIKRRLEEEGSIFQTTIDSEVIVHLIARSKRHTIREALTEALAEVRGAYSLLVMTENEIIAARDPSGFRPLCIGLIDNSYCVASESCALDQIGAQYIRSINPNEMVVINKSGISSYVVGEHRPITQCIFELIYLSRPDSIVFDKSVYQIRKEFGRILAEECSSIRADLVIPVPDSGVTASLGYSERSGIPYEMGFLRNHYVGRTFIHPNQAFRSSKVRIKLSPVSQIISGKRVIVIDDSIVRGTTCKEILRMLYSSGAKEVHVLVSSPMITHSCFYGIDTPNREVLLSYTCDSDINKITKFIGADSVYYLSIKGMLSALGKDSDNYCLACFNGEYPVFPSDFHKKQGLARLK